MYGAFGEVELLDVVEQIGTFLQIQEHLKQQKYRHKYQIKHVNFRNQSTPDFMEIYSSQQKDVFIQSKYYISKMNKVITKVKFLSFRPIFPKLQLTQVSISEGLHKLYHKNKNDIIYSSNIDLLYFMLLTSVFCISGYGQQSNIIKSLVKLNPKYILLNQIFKSMTDLISQSGQLQQLQQQVKMLRDYSQALQAQNKTRNQQRIILQKQIDRLSRIQKSNNKNTQPCQQCTRYKSDIIKLENQVQRLKRQNTNLQSSYNVLSETLSKYNMVSSSATSTKVTTSTNVSSNNAKSQLEIKYKELSDKYDEINYQNLNLKKQMQDLTKSIQSQPNTQKILSKLQQQKQALNIKVSSLELQIHNLKYLMSTKDNEIFTYKSKQTALLSLEIELKSVKQAVQNRDKEISSLRQKLAEFSNLEFQIRNLKTSLATKDNEINSLKAQITRNQQQLSKVYKLESEIRNLKYQITSKDTQIQTLKSRSNQISANQYSKLASTELELKNTRSALAAKDSQLSIAKAQVGELSSLRIKLSTAQNECRIWKSKYQEQANNKKINSSLSISNAQYLGQIEQLKNEITKLKSESVDNDNYTRRVEDELKEMTRRDEEKNIEVKKLDKIVNSYVEKIGQLQVELNRLERNSVSGSASTIAINNQVLIVQNRTLNQKIQDLQRRISILQQTNKNLREQLRLAIQLRSRQSSRLITSPTPIQRIPSEPIHHDDQQLINTIKQLKSELENNKNHNNRMRMDNEYLQAKLSSAELQIQHLIGLTNKGGIRIVGQRSQGKDINMMSVLSNNRGLTRMPAVQNSKTMYQQSVTSSLSPPPIKKEIRIQHDYTVMDDHQRNPNTSMPDKPLNYRISEPSYTKGGRQRSSLRDNDRPVQITNIGNTGISKNKYNSKVSTGWSKTGDTTDPKSLDILQKRIQMLKQQNKGLRKNLYQPN